MSPRALGRTGISVPLVGLGCGPLGDARLSDEDVERLLRVALEQGLTLFDTAPSYGLSEARIGRFLRGSSSSRAGVIVVTKLGYGVAGVPDWTPACLSLGVDQALATLGVDVLDVALLHSCSEDRLADEGLLRALMDAKQAGKIRAFGYSGDGAGLVAAVRSGAFDVVECSVSCLDRSGLDAVRGAGLGVIAKRALANAPWRGNPDGRDDIAEYVRRYDALFGSAPMTFADDELFLRFASFLPEVHCTLVGTTRADAIVRAAELVARGPLPAAVTDELRARYAPFERVFHGVV
jgi:aryl-alcohol dehydrogenase-like predicted oxidoreductase